ncbi:hypothetical protein B0A49_12598 [Cryomyces minteri]|uniref:BHLH domain-containing protein n=1 Tax=Cryomyces minteri TaxID=331657 RepID=A0A4U0WK03_9PEZI|nr:hypothetical protein B0A49_12598 [Cryomyces minteri]
MPFGYAFDDNAGYGNTQQPPPPPGPCLLDANDYNVLDDFFRNPENYGQQIDPSLSGAVSAGYEAKDDTQSSFDFSFGPPATAPNPATSLTTHAQPTFGHMDVFTDPMQHNGNTFASNAYANIGQQGIPSSTTDDVLGAASTLYHTVHAGQPPAFHDNPYYTNFPPADLQSPMTSSGRQSTSSYYASSNAALSAAPNPYMSTYPPQDIHVSASGYIGYDPTQPRLGITPRPRPFLNPLSQSRAYSFGSDSNFNNNGYVAPMRQETEEDITKRLMLSMEVLQSAAASGNTTANNTQPSSPVLTRTQPLDPASAAQRARKRPSPVRGQAMASAVDSEDDDDEGEDNEPTSKRRRKSKGKGQVKIETDQDFKPNRKAELNNIARRHSTLPKPKRNPSQTSPSHSTPTRSGKPSTAADPSAAISGSTDQNQDPPSTRKTSTPAHPNPTAKSQRENLTDEQKRNNHIKSEQKRRNAIQQGFNDLNAMVPELRQGGFSKSSMLVETADFLEELVRGDGELERELMRVGVGGDGKDEVEGRD